MDYPALKFEAANQVSVPELENSKVEEVALAKILFGIAKEWELEPKDLDPILGVARPTIAGWRDKMRIPVPKNRIELNHNQILRFINLWQSLSSLISSREGQMRWLKEPNKGMDNKSPIQILSENPENLANILELVDRLRNP